MIVVATYNMFFLRCKIVCKMIFKKILKPTLPNSKNNNKKKKVYIAIITMTLHAIFVNFF